VAVGHGWIRRAERLLEGMAAGPELASLRVWQAHIALVVDEDLGRARTAAEEACRIASGLDLAAVETQARGQLGMIHALEGDVAAGLELLDETAAAGLAGEHDDLRAAGLGACYMLSTCEVLHDFVRARQWCERATEWAGRHDLTASGIFCRNHFCKVLLWQGEWDALERELDGLLATLVSVAPAFLPGGRVQLAELRRRQGRREEAHALLDASDAHSGSLLVRAGASPRVASIPSGRRLPWETLLDVNWTMQKTGGDAEPSSSGDVGLCLLSGSGERRSGAFPGSMGPSPRVVGVTVPSSGLCAVAGAVALAPLSPPELDFTRPESPRTPRRTRRGGRG
jgi:hypothetical protein